MNKSIEIVARVDSAEYGLRGNESVVEIDPADVARVEIHFAGEDGIRIAATLRPQDASREDREPSTLAVAQGIAARIALLDAQKVASALSTALKMVLYNDDKDGALEEAKRALDAYDRLNIVVVDKEVPF